MISQVNRILRLGMLLTICFYIFFSVSLTYANSSKDQNVKGITKKLEIKKLEFDVDNDSNADFKVLLSCTTPDINFGTIKAKETLFKYMSSTNYSFSLAQKGKKVGLIELVVDKVLPDNSYLVFLKYSCEKSNINLKYEIIGYNASDGKLISIGKTDNKYAFITKKTPQSGELDNSVLYYEGKASNIKLNSVVNTKSLGSSVYTVEPSNLKVGVTSNTTQCAFEYNLKSIAKTEIRTNCILSGVKLVDWKNDFACRTAMNMDFYNDNVYFSDGPYRKNMYNYVPRSNTKNTYFKNPSGLQVRACSWVLKNGSLFRTMGIYCMYEFTQSYNKAGYIPTQPKSEWLSKDYGIGYNFYDTRFNSDSATSIMSLYEYYPDEYVLKKIKNYIAFYLKYYKEKQYKIGKATFVPDYMDASGKNKINPTSLNHFIAENEVLYHYYRVTGDKAALIVAREMLSSVVLTSKKWIKSDGDLWYRVTPDNKFNTYDYPLVTYNDLLTYKDCLIKTEGKVPQEIENLLQSKTNWAKKNGYIK